MTTAVTAIVNRVVHKNIEDKYSAASNGNPNSASFPAAQTFTCAIDNVSKIYPLLPLISQGTSDFQRVGDKIHPTHLVVKFTMTCSGSPTTNSSEQLWGRLFILHDKGIKDGTLLSSTPITTQLIDVGNGTTSGYNGFPCDNNFRVNKRRYRVYHDKLIKFQRGYGTLPQAGNPVPFIGDQIYTSPLATHQMTLRVPVPKVLSYAQELDTWPSNWAPFFCFGYQDPQALAAHKAGEMDYRVAISWTSHFDYEDA